MRKSLLSIILICVINFSGKLMAQCTPDTSLHSSGTFPEVLAVAKVGVPYEQVIQYFITEDTLVYVPQIGQTLNAHIDTVRILTVKGMPAGFTYDCHNAQCKIVGGSAGCATLRGTPAAMSGGIYPLEVILAIRATAYLGRLPIAQTVNDTIYKYAIVVESPSGNAEMVGAEQAILYPNPVREELQVFIPETKGNIQYCIKNLNGQLMEEGEWLKGNDVHKVSTRLLEAGIYLLELNSDAGVKVHKFVVNPGN